jgi:hypothetical protein
MTEEERQKFTTFVPQRTQSNSKVKPDYKGLVSGFQGTMEEWDKLVLETHDAFGYGFDYVELCEHVIEKISEDMPSSRGIIDGNKLLAVDELVIKLLDIDENKFIEMLAVIDKQEGTYWRGELEENDLLSYGLVDL